MNFERSSEGLNGSQTWFVVAENILVTIYFIGATFFTQIVILNMLIAIMSSTFDKH